MDTVHYRERFIESNEIMEETVWCRYPNCEEEEHDILHTCKTVYFEYSLDGVNFYRNFVGYGTIEDFVDRMELIKDRARRYAFFGIPGVTGPSAPTG